eukprot:TRINITY_DN216_c1_g1_i5.p1 TRINITY_DN216_c1_g1~~TRINITY_DN216_c1_g1_i5.p1  ORF type:complete len:400 (+),score=65.04 TRINITY_DN216_c1_g1_i5:180-1379(+)
MARTWTVDEVLAVIRAARDKSEARPGGDDASPLPQQMSLKRKLAALAEADDPECLLAEVTARAQARSVGASSWEQYAVAARAWGAFAKVVRIPAFPVCPVQAVRFAALYRRKGTLDSAISALQKVHGLLGVAVVIRSPALAEVASGIGRSQDAKRRAAAIRTAHMDAFVADARPLVSPRRPVPLVTFRRIAVLAYVFLLRVQNECLPLLRGRRADVPATIVDDLRAEGRHSAVFIFAGKLHVALRRRKRHPHGELLVRGCTCRSRAVTTGWRALCPVHVVWPVFASLPDGAPLFAARYAEVLAAVKEMAARHGVGRDEAARIGTHGFRRGAAQDVQEDHPELYHLLAAGSWSSRAFRDYMDWQRIAMRCQAQLPFAEPAGGGVAPAGAPPVLESSSDED